MDITLEMVEKVMSATGADYAKVKAVLLETEGNTEMFEFDDDDDFINDYTGTLPVKLTDTLAKHKPLEANRAPARKAKKTQVKPLSNPKFHVDEDDTFKLDFIDFDE